MSDTRERLEALEACLPELPASDRQRPTPPPWEVRHAAAASQARPASVSSSKENLRPIGF